MLYLTGEKYVGQKCKNFLEVTKNWLSKNFISWKKNGYFGQAYHN